MMDPYDRFELMIDGRVVKTPVAVASMAGVVDASYVLAREKHVGLAFIGGYSIDGKTMDAAREMAESGRTEFLYDSPVDELKKQLEMLERSDVVAGINLRGSSPDSYKSIAKALGTGVIYEIDAHCRQAPMIEAGCGEYFLNHPETLVETIQALKSAGVIVSVKIRAGVSKNDSELARTIWKAGADMIHVDLMDFGHAKLRQIRNSCPLMIVANNSVNSFSRMKEMLAHGADLISVARKSDSETLQALNEGVKSYADETGWYNVPKQLCRGGDIRSLTFCCMPVKDCPLIPLLNRIDMSKKEYVEFKLEAVKNTPINGGEQTCFGGLVWCCKSSTPCMFRDMALQQAGITMQDYMRYKRRLSEKIMAKVFDERSA